MCFLLVSLIGRPLIMRRGQGAKVIMTSPERRLCQWRKWWRSSKQIGEWELQKHCNYVLFLIILSWGNYTWDSPWHGYFSGASPCLHNHILPLGFPLIIGIPWGLPLVTGVPGVSPHHVVMYMTDNSHYGSSLSTWTCTPLCTPTLIKGVPLQWHLNSG